MMATQHAGTRKQHMPTLKNTPDVIILMGPAGCGKTTTGKALSAQTGWPFIEGDDHHPSTNKRKLAAGQALHDEDRVIWVDSITAAVNVENNDHLILGCSALTPYVQRRLINECRRNCIFVMLDVSRAVLNERLYARQGHFMPPTLLSDQLSALTPRADAITINADQPTDIVCTEILTALKSLS